MPPEWTTTHRPARDTIRTSPYRLYRLMVPVSHLQTRDVVFPGEDLWSHSHFTAENLTLVPHRHSFDSLQPRPVRHSSSLVGTSIDRLLLVS
jgi:hypothetical protein